jgi:hypothetical protein
MSENLNKMINQAMEAPNMLQVIEEDEPTMLGRYNKLAAFKAEQAMWNNCHQTLHNNLLIRNDVKDYAKSHSVDQIAEELYYASVRATMSEHQDCIVGDIPSFKELNDEEKYPYQVTATFITVCHK